jgi:hypothetical protein
MNLLEYCFVYLNSYLYQIHIDNKNLAKLLKVSLNYKLHPLEERNRLVTIKFDRQSKLSRQLFEINNFVVRDLHSHM